jgi:hypothetical protein
MNEFGRNFEKCDCLDRTRTIRCDSCNIVYCADCHNTRIWVNTPQGKQSVRCCPKCISTSLHHISFDDSTSINVAMAQMAVNES